MTASAAMLALVLLHPSPGTIACAAAVVVIQIICLYPKRRA